MVLTPHFNEVTNLSVTNLSKGHNFWLIFFKLKKTKWGLKITLFYKKKKGWLKDARQGEAGRIAYETKD